MFKSTQPVVLNGVEGEHNVCSGLQDQFMRGYRGRSPPLFRPSDPALCVSHPLVTPYYCRLGDLLCFVFIVSLLYFSVNCVMSVFLQYFDTVGWVLRPVKNRRPYNLYCVGGDVKPCSINQSINQCSS